MILRPSILALQPPHVRAALERAGRPAKVARTKPRRGSSQPAEPPSVAVVEGVSVEVVIGGLRLDVTPNSRDHFHARARKVARQRAVVDAVLAGVTPPRGARYVVRITRRSPGTLDGDNATASAKGARDSCASWLGCDDRDPCIEWVVTQERAPWGVRIVVKSLSDGVTLMSGET